TARRRRPFWRTRHSKPTARAKFLKRRRAAWAVTVTQLAISVRKALTMYISTSRISRSCWKRRNRKRGQNDERVNASRASERGPNRTGRRSRLWKAYAADGACGSGRHDRRRHGGSGYADGCAKRHFGHGGLHTVVRGTHRASGRQACAHHGLYRHQATLF